MSDCKKYMCGKNIHTLKEWRDEMLRLRKEHAPAFETHPDYVKTAQCKDEIQPAVTCNRLFPAKKTSRPVPKTKPSTKRSPQYTKEYERYVQEVQEHEKNLAELKRLKVQLRAVKEQLKRIQTDIRMHIYACDVEQKKLDVLRVKITKSISTATDAQMFKFGAQLQSQERLLRELLEDKAKHEAKLPPKEKEFKDLVDVIELLAIKTEHKPVYQGKTPGEFQYDERKRCPNGYKRNKTTKKCVKK